jgi:hypothetical protein
MTCQSAETPQKSGEPRYFTDDKTPLLCVDIGCAGVTSRNLSRRYLTLNAKPGASNQRASAAQRLPRGLIASYAESLKMSGWKGSTSLNSGVPSMFLARAKVL